MGHGLIRRISSALGSLESLAPSVSIETELAMEQMKERYEQEIQDLKIQLETKVQAKHGNIKWVTQIRVDSNSQS